LAGEMIYATTVIITRIVLLYLCEKLLKLAISVKAKPKEQA
jgi:hypothetical protein